MGQLLDMFNAPDPTVFGSGGEISSIFDMPNDDFLEWQAAKKESEPIAYFPALGKEALPSPDQFGTSQELTYRQMIAERRANRELMRQGMDFEAAGLGDEYKKFKEHGGSSTLMGIYNATMENAIEPAFDMVSMFNYGTAGAVQELLRTGSAWEGFKQGAVEIANALPGIELESARRPSFIDVFNEQGVSKWWALGAGLALDLVLDPMNYVPGMAIAKKLKVGGAALKARSGKLGKGFDFLFKTNRHLRKGTEEEVALADKLIRKLGLSEVKANNMTVKLLDEVDSMVSWMEPHEQVLFGLMQDQPSRLKKELASWASTGLIDAKELPKYEKTIDTIADYTQRLGLDEVKAGILSEDMLADFYVHGMEALNPRVRRAFQRVVKEKKKFVQVGQNTTQPLGRRAPFAYGKEFKTNWDRFMASLDGRFNMTTELNIRNILAKRSTDHAKWVTTREFINDVVGNKDISTDLMKVEGFDKTVFNSPKKWGKVKGELNKTNPGYKVFEVKKTMRNAEGEPVENIVGAYLMPENVVDYVSKADRLISNEDDLSRALNSIERATSWWRGMATVGPGFVARNYMGLLFNNWLAGVGTEYGKLGMPLPGGFLKKHLQALQVQRLARGAGRAPTWLQKSADVTAKELGYKSLDDVPFLRLIDPDTGKPMTMGKVIELGEAHGVPESTTKLYNLPEDHMDRVWRSGKSTNKHIPEMAGVDPVVQKAIEISAGVKRNAGEIAERVVGKENWLMQQTRSWSQIVENNGRWALFLDRLEKGASVEEAALATKTWHFDYRNLTDIEKRGFRWLMPFYAWTRFAGPRMAMAMVENPGRFSRMPKVKRAIERLSAEWGELEKPDYYDEVQALQLPFVARDKPLFLQLDLPVLELNRWNKKDMMSGLHPVIKGLIETAPSMGHSLFTGAPFESFEGEESSVLPFLTKTQEAQLQNFLPVVGKPLRAVKAYSRGELVEQAISEFAGVRIRPYDLRKVTRGNTFRDLKLARDFRKLMEQEGKLPPRR